MSNLQPIFAVKQNRCGFAKKSCYYL